MAERDRFETDLADALRTYAKSAPTQVRPAELARHFATAYPHRRTLLGAWRPMAVARPSVVARFAWVLLLLAGLLAAMLGGMLLVGSLAERDSKAVLPPDGELYTCPPGTDPDEPGPVDQARPPQATLASMAFDRRAGRLVALADIPTGDEVTGVETWTFDVCTNTWTRMHPDREPPQGTGQLVYDVDSDVTILFAGFEVWVYDYEADAWTQERAAPTGEIEIGPIISASYDPVTGLVVTAAASDPQLLWNYDVETDSWTPIHQANGWPGLGSGSYGSLAYDTSVDRLVAYADQAYGSPPYETWHFDIRTGTWTESRAERPPVVAWLTGPRLVYHEAAERTVVYMRDPLTAYDASTDRWTILAAADAVDPQLMAYDSVNRRLVGWEWGGYDVPAGAVHALDLATGEWTVLLEPTPGQTAATRIRCYLGGQAGWMEGSRCRPDLTAAPLGGTNEAGLTPAPTASPPSTP